jgi:GTP-binding protein
MIDAELTREMEKDLPDIPHVFISSHTRFHLQKLTDLLWKELNS